MKGSHPRLDPGKKARIAIDFGISKVIMVRATGPGLESPVITEVYHAKRDVEACHR